MKKTRGGKRATNKKDEAASGAASKTVYSAGRNKQLLDATDNIIVHLNIQDTETSCGSVNPYNDGTTAFQSEYAYVDIQPPHSDNTEPDNPPQGLQGEDSLKKYTTLLEEFSKKTDTSEWPCSTSVLCHWCCHSFKGSPVALPTRMCLSEYNKIEKCEVTGCFCSFACAAAHNFDNCNDADEMWERYAMLNRMYYECSLQREVARDKITRVIPAPPRTALQVFGGYLSIEEFREKTDNLSENCGATLIDVLNVPITFVPQQVEEINEADIAQPLKFIPIDQERINKVREKLQLRRTKPLIDAKHTLDHIMNLKFTTNECA